MKNEDTLQMNIDAFVEERLQESYKNISNNEHYKKILKKYYSLFDNIYRVIQKDIKSHDSEYVTEWSKRQQFASETLVENIFKNIVERIKEFFYS